MDLEEINLVDDLKVNIGDRILLKEIPNSMNSEETGKWTGYVADYSPTKVTLSNRNTRNGNGKIRRITKWYNRPNRYVGEKIIKLKLKKFVSYEISEEAVPKILKR